MQERPVLFIAMTFLLLPACSSGMSGTAIGALPQVKPSPVVSSTTMPVISTAWTYQQSLTTVTPLASSTQAGTLTIRYMGMNLYRGSSYYTTESRSTITSPPFVTSFYTISAGQAYEYAGALFNFAIVPGCNASPQFEDVLDTPAAFSEPADMSIGETVYRCGQPPSTSASTIKVADVAINTASTPGGAFASQVRTGRFSSFGQFVDYLDYVVGNTVVERDTSFYNQHGALTATATVKYMTGPLNVVFPGPPMLFAQQY